MVVAISGDKMEIGHTEKIDWLGHASFRLRGSKQIYIDPWKVEGAPHDGDLILVTHSHYDHLNTEDIARVSKPGAIVIAPNSAAEKLNHPGAKLVNPGDTLIIEGITIEAVPAYNTNKDFHPRSQDWVGYIVELDGLRIYHTGDSDLIDEMRDVNCHVALVPVSGTYVLTAAEAVEAVRLIEPEIAIPMHWGDIVGSEVDAAYFRDHASCKVVIKERVK